MTAGWASAALGFSVLLSAPHSVLASARQGEAASVLVVPFLQQSEQLCGGAAAAMVLRYWGEREVFPEDFAPLIEAREAGIRGTVLADAIKHRGSGWIAQPSSGSLQSIKEHLTAGRPLIALIEDHPGRHHYVVLVGWLEGHVVLHDPARAPFRVVAEDTFSQSWAATDFWTLLILPRSERRDASAGRREPSPGVERARIPDVNSCDALVSEGVRLAQTGDRASAESVLSAAAVQCPAAARAARELAGLRFVQSRWREASELAARAAALAPDDAQAWRLLASSLFIRDDADGALRAWNRANEPKIDLVRVEGLVRTPQATVERLLDLEPRTELTAIDLRRARRRLAMLPSATATRVGYRPVAGGLAEVDAAIVERPPFVDGAGIVGVAAHAVTHRELRFDAAVPPDGGARWIASWRWWEGRPRLGFSLLTPAAFGRSGFWRLDGFWEQQSYALRHPEGQHVLRENRKRLELSYSDWVAADTRVGLGLALDRWSPARTYAALSWSIEQRLAKDHIAARAHGGMWPALGRSSPFATGGFALAWRSTSPSELNGRMLLTARAGLDSASNRAPLDVWPGAGVGQARSLLARAHPLLRDGVVEDGIFGRTLAHGGLELDVRAATRGWTTIGVAVFGDVARTWHALAAPAGPLHVDVGFGLRVGLAGQAQTLRIDVAHGLRDGRNAISAGWVLPWPDGH
jgi:tetratricopeptide (TPR) repeat protein